MSVLPIRSALRRRGFSKEAGLLVLLAVPLLAFLVLQVNPHINHSIAVPVHHFFIVAITAILAIILAAAVLRVALHLRHTPTFLLGLGFLSIAGIFLVHGLSTGGILVGPNRIATVSARLSLLVGSVFLAASVWTEDSSVSRWINQRMPWLLGAWIAVLVAFGVVALAAPPLVEAIPIAEPPLSFITFVVTLLLLGIAATGYWRRFLQTQLPLVWALAVAAVLLFEAEVSMYFGVVWRLNWWEYHVLMLSGFSLGVGALLWEFWKERSLRRIMEGMFALRSIVELELEYSDAISVLAAATEAKDPYTHGHTVRVAEWASRIGREMELPPSRIRVLARSGLLHDVGKLGVPDAILNKPGPLTAQEFAVIKLHPQQGHDILRRVGRLEEEIRIILAHHERMDGAGYPQGLAGEEIPLEARILAVADVFDSLTTDRPYRAALSHEEALAIIRKETGSHLDLDCVDALFRLLNVPTDRGEEYPQWEN